MKHLLLILMCLAFCALASCTGSYYKSPMLVSTKVSSVPVHKVLGKVESKDCHVGALLYFVSPADFRKMYSKVLDEAMAKGGDAVIDFQIRETSATNIFFLYSRFCYLATGTAVKFTSGASAWDVSPESSKGGTSEWDASPEEINKQETKSTWD